jgi:hypothetical protein
MRTLAEALSMPESCTLYEAIVLLAYGDAEIAKRYGGRDNYADGGRRRFLADRRHVLSSGLPSAEALVAMRDKLRQEDTSARAVEQRLREAWEAEDTPKIKTAKNRLREALRHGHVTAYGPGGPVPCWFWVRHRVGA